MKLDKLKSTIIPMIIDTGKSEIESLELPPSDLSSVIYTICKDIEHEVYLQLKKEGIIKD